MVPERGVYSEALPFVMPNVTPGNYYLLLEIDPYNHIYESSEKNQIYVEPIQIRVPDLLVAAIDAPAEADVGQNVTVA